MEKKALYEARRAKKLAVREMERKKMDGEEDGEEDGEKDGEKDREKEDGGKDGTVMVV